MAKLVRWTPAQTVARRHNLTGADKLFDELWNSMWEAREARNDDDSARPMQRPAMDVIEQDNAVIVRVDLPGIRPEDVNIEIERDQLVITGTVAEEQNEEIGRVTYRERRYGGFQRSLRLGDTLDTEHAEASFEHGVLTLTLPKRPEVQPRRIEVQHS